MLDAIIVGEKIKMTTSITSDYPVSSTATILYIDEYDMVSIEWNEDGRLSTFSDRQVLDNFEKVKTGA